MRLMLHCLKTIILRTINVIYLTNLFVNIVSPKPRLGSLIWVRGEQGRCVMPNLINVLEKEEGFRNGFSIVNQNRDHLVKWVHLKKQRAFVCQVLLPGLIFDPFLSQSDPHSHPIRAWPKIQKHQFVLHLNNNASNEIAEIFIAACRC